MQYTDEIEQDKTGRDGPKGELIDIYEYTKLSI